MLVLTTLQEAQYDLVLTDPAIPTGAILSHYLKLPLVFNVRWTSQGEGHFSISPSPLSYIPMTGTELTDKMSFLERLLNAQIFGFTEYQIAQYVLPHYVDLIVKYFGPDADFFSMFQAGL